MTLTIISKSDIKNDPASMGALDENGILQVMPAQFYQQFTTAELAAFCVRNGNYSLPTTELVDWLKDVVGARSMLEIGAGNGVLAKALGIRATDNWMQTWPDVAAHYKQIQQPTVSYGEWVENLDAHAAITEYKPDVVLACWVTHLYREDRHELGGNMYGVDEEALLAACQTYVHVGNSRTHANKSIRQLPHRSYRFGWLVSRSMQPELNEICIWGARLPGEPEDA
ncbi:hypothetical protein WJ96_04815 [Burkholderia ubonensis]|uniref:Class I SAM-dependent methyltransferase n=1 Tax=Burkholderia ubonensis TaxID=101571 RepID=A0AAW3MWC2_9BURK|nr:hypothetical protein [Burkholderia ubonensis]KVP75090.1 hypothetical protein WJ93_06655 [Burkholderia ubonensis]KVP97895.1 hypothetical protein WJ96_04815 [Burkholderia ubonensis]KVZ92592.1 hypothetical protein WL25_16470 [Burkholderia ubonensis]